MPSINPQAVRGPVTAVPVVAGDGVRFVEDVENNRVVAEVDETVLYEDTDYTYGRDSVTLSEDYRNFECLKIFTSKGNIQFFYPGNEQGVTLFTLTSMTNGYLWLIPWTFQSDGVTYSGATGKIWTVGTTTTVDVPSNAGSNRWIQPTKIVGINRIASN